MFLNSKSIYLRYLKTFSKVLNIFLSPLGAKSCVGIFLEFLEPLRYFSGIKNDFNLFLELSLILKWDNYENKIFSNPSNIYGLKLLVKPFPNFETPSPV
jgi:hypothetical protein